MWSYRVNLDKRVRSDHPLRRINVNTYNDVSVDWFNSLKIRDLCQTKSNSSNKPNTSWAGNRCRPKRSHDLWLIQIISEKGE